MLIFKEETDPLLKKRGFSENRERGGEKPTRTEKDSTSVSYTTENQSIGGAVNDKKETATLLWHIHLKRRHLRKRNYPRSNSKEGKKNKVAIT